MWQACKAWHLLLQRWDHACSCKRHTGDLQSGCHLVSIEDAQDLVARDGQPVRVQLAADVVDVAALAIHLPLGTLPPGYVYKSRALAVNPCPFCRILTVVTPASNCTPLHCLLSVLIQYNFGMVPSTKTIRGGSVTHLSCDKACCCFGYCVGKAVSCYSMVQQSAKKLTDR